MNLTIVTGSTLDSSPAVQGGPPGPSVADDIRLLKAGLLYADTIMLCGSGTSLALKLEEKIERDIENKVSQIIPSAADTHSREVLASYLRNSADRLLARYASRESRDALHAATDQQLVGVEFYDYEHHNLSFKSDELPTGYFQSAEFYSTVFRSRVDMLSEVFDGARTYPMLDGHAQSFARFGEAVGILAPSGTAVERSKHGAVSKDLLLSLPTFDGASIDQILDIRRSLQTPLVPFRNAVDELSSELRGAAWHPDTHHDVEELLRNKVEPTLAELRSQADKIRSDSSMPELIRRAQVPSSLWVGFATLRTLYEFSALAGVTVGGVEAAGKMIHGVKEAIRDVEKAESELQQHRMYFYHSADQALRTSGSARAGQT